MSEAYALSSADFDRVEAILERACGLTLSKALRRALQDSFTRAAQSMGLGPGDYLERLAAGEPESISSLVEHSVIGETYFFRHPEHFAAFQRKLLTEFRNEPSITAWSAGCATGEEPFTLAMSLLEVGRAGRIVATDVSSRALERARTGVFGPWSFRRFDPVLRQRYFDDEPAGARIKDVPRRMVEFRQHNLTTDAPPLYGCHLVLCRNVLIYFTPELTARVLHKLVDALRPGGLLVIGPVELPQAAALELEWVDCDGVTLLRKPTGERRPEPARPVLRAFGPPPMPSAPTPVPKSAPLAALPKARPASVPAAPSRPAEPAPLPDPRLEGFERAREAARRGDLDEAESLARESATKELVPESFLLLSITAESRGDLKQAIDSVRRALYLDPDLATGHAALVPLFLRVGQPQEAERARRNALRALEGLSESALLRGVESITAGALRRALEQTGPERGWGT